MPRPSDSFMTDLKKMDDRLDCRFNYDTERFVVTYKRATGEPVPIYVIQDNGQFRMPDRRDLDTIFASDTWEDKKEYLARAAKYAYDYQIQHSKTAYQQIRDMTKDNKIQLMRHATRNTKANPFRRF